MATMFVLLLPVLLLVSVKNVSTSDTLTPTIQDRTCKGVTLPLNTISSTLMSVNKNIRDLFCYPWLQLYSNPEGTGFPSICLRGTDAQNILDADAFAKAHFIKLGGSRFYRRSFGKVAQISTPSDSYRTSLEDKEYKPPNWCEHYMHSMLCHIAFPQMVGSSTLNIRPVCHQGCQRTLRNCNRWTPSDGEIEGTSMPFFINEKQDSEHCQKPLPLTNPAYCTYWNNSCGLSRGLGSTVSSEGDHENCVHFDAQLDFSMN